MLSQGVDASTGDLTTRGVQDTDGILSVGRCCLIGVGKGRFVGARLARDRGQGPLIGAA